MASPSTSAPTISEDYYLINFEHLLELTSMSYRHVLEPGELQWCEQVSGLPEPARRLYVRLLCRRGNHFRVDKLNYPEIGDLQQASASLAAAGLVSLNPALDLETALSLLLRGELAAQLPEKPRSGLRRDAIEALVVEAGIKPAELLSSLTIIALHHREIFDIYKLCFFGNAWQDMSEFVLRDLGLHRFEDYVVDSTTSMFPSREHLQAHLQFYELETQGELAMQGSVADIDMLVAALPTALDRALARRIDRLRIRLARQLERWQAWHAALSAYRHAQRPPARERIVRVLAQLQRFDEAMALCDAMQASPWAEEEAVFAEFFKPQLRKKAGLETASRKRFKPVSESIALALPTAPVTDAVDADTAAGIAAGIAADSTSDRATENTATADGAAEDNATYKPGTATDKSHASSPASDTRRIPVELVCRDYYAQQGECFYVENTLITGLFGLCFWDIIFAPVAGAFNNPFQYAPSDFGEVGFVAAREALISNRLQELVSRDEIARRVSNTLTEKQGRMNPMVNWRYLDPACVELALERIPASHLLVMFRRLLADLKANRNGLPDLVLFPHSGGYCFIEVKGPGDQVQKNQQRWFRFFETEGIPYKVCHLSWLPLSTR